MKYERTKLGSLPRGRIVVFRSAFTMRGELQQWPFCFLVLPQSKQTQLQSKLVAHGLTLPARLESSRVNRFEHPSVASFRTRLQNRFALPSRVSFFSLLLFFAVFFFFLFSRPAGGNSQSCPRRKYCYFHIITPDISML